MSRRVLIIGASGFVGSHVRPALEEAGFTTRLTSRSPERARAAHGGDWVRFDVEDPTGEAFEDVDAVVYLVHQMRDGGADLQQREVGSARRVAALAGEAGVRRLVFLGAPSAPTRSHHLEARLATGIALREGPVPCIELQAAMIIGNGSESWWICRDLALRLPVMTLPPWARSRSEPIGVADVVRALVACVDLPIEGSCALALQGPEALSAEQILRRVAHLAGASPRMIHVPLLTPSISSHWLRLVTRADIGVARQLVDGLETDLIATGPSFWDRVDFSPTPFDDAVRAALEGEPKPPSRLARGWERALRRVGR